MASATAPVASQKKLVAIQDINGARMIFKDALFSMNELPEGSSEDHLIASGAARVASLAELHAGRANVANSDMITELDGLRAQVNAQKAIIATQSADLAKMRSLGNNVSPELQAANKADAERLQKMITELQNKLNTSEQQRFTLQAQFNDQETRLKKIRDEHAKMQEENGHLQQALDEATSDKPAETKTGGK